MNAFSFRTVADIICETGALKRLPQLLAARFSVRKLLIVTDAFLGTQACVLDTTQQLRDAGFEVSVDTSVQADPPEAVVLASAQSARDAGVELVIGLGGGSSMDVAKLVAVLAFSTTPLKEMYGIGNCKGPRLPLVQIPTTAGTGSEVTPISIVTTGETTKMGVVSPVLYADLAVLDAELTLALPRKTTAATGIDAMVHAIEAYTTKHLKNPYSDLLALRALELLSANLMKVCENGADVAARQAMLLGSMLAGQAFANAPCAAVHALAYPLGGFFHVSHGLSNALLLPEVMRFNAPVSTHLYAEIADVVCPTASGSAEAKTQSFIKWCENLAINTGIERKLREVGVTENDIATLADAAMLQTRLLGNNPRDLSRADAYNIYQAVL
jgi:alcohol dehydrogenase